MNGEIKVEELDAELAKLEQKEQKLAAGEAGEAASESQKTEAPVPETAEEKGTEAKAEEQPAQAQEETSCLLYTSRCV